jgi:hypothetical protein
VVFSFLTDDDEEEYGNAALIADCIALENRVEVEEAKEKKSDAAFDAL